MSDSREPIIGRRIIFRATTSSTMDEVATFADAGEAEGLVVRANRQTAGRGRGGRQWTVPAGSSILASALLRPPVPAVRLAVLPLLAGVAVAKTIEGIIGRSCQLKWPNDVWINERKVSGILMTARAVGEDTLCVVLGTGINVNIPVDELVPGATSLLAAGGRRIDVDDVFARLLAELNEAYCGFVAANGMPLLDDWRKRAALQDELVMLRNEGEELSGWMRGIDERGQLLLEVAPGEIREIVAGELTRGPVRI